MNFIGKAMGFVKDVGLYIYRKFKGFVIESQELLREQTPLERIAYICVVGLVAFAVLNFMIESFMSLLAIGLVSIFINRLIDLESFKLSPMTKDLSSPLLSVPVFALSTALYFVMPEIVIVLAVLVLPFLFRDFKKKFNEYNNELTPLEAK